MAAREYCTKRLHRLRKGKGLKMLQGRRTFEKKEVVPEKVTDVRCVSRCVVLWCVVLAVEACTTRKFSGSSSPQRLKGRWAVCVCVGGGG